MFGDTAGGRRRDLSESGIRRKLAGCAASDLAAPIYGEAKPKNTKTARKGRLSVRREVGKIIVWRHDFPSPRAPRQLESRFRYCGRLRPFLRRVSPPESRAMPFCQPISRPRRPKLFGAGRPLPLDREAKRRIWVRARALRRRTVKGRAYGDLTAKALDVLEALLWRFHNAKTGLCFPSLERIAEAAGCARSTVAEAIKALEACGLLSWVHRLVRRSEHDAAAHCWRIRVLRTSNGYRLHDPRPARSPEIPPKPSKSENPTGTKNQVPIPSIDARATPLEMALVRFGEAFKAGGAAVA